MTLTEAAEGQNCPLPWPPRVQACVRSAGCVPGSILDSEKKVKNKTDWAQLSWRLSFIGEEARPYKQINEPCCS